MPETFKNSSGPNGRNYDGKGPPRDFGVLGRFIGDAAELFVSEDAEDRRQAGKALIVIVPLMIIFFLAMIWPLL